MRFFSTRYFVLLVLLFVGFSTISRADFKVTKIGDSLIDAEALTIKGNFGQAINGLSFQQDAMVTHKDHQYVTYYDGGRHVCLARRKLPTGDWQIIRFDDYDFQSNDSHNIISMGICPKDGTIHLAFDHHVHPLHYRFSRKGVANDPEGVRWEASLFGPVLSELEKGKPIKITYPRFLQTPDGGLQFCYRRGGSGNGDRMLVDWDYETVTWKNTRQIDSRAGLFEDERGASTTRCSYPNGYNYGPNGNLHTTWVWRESSQGSNHDLIYCYSEDLGRTWLNNRGEAIDGPPSVVTPGIKVVEIRRALGLLNTHGQAVDSQGRIHAVVSHCTEKTLKEAGSKPGEFRWGPPEARRYHHYWRDAEGCWHHVELPIIAGNRPKLYIDEFDNAYMIFCDAWRNHLFCSKGSLVIAAATAASNWKDWKVIHDEPGPFLNEMLGDLYRWKSEKVLSIMVQESPEEPHQSTPLRIVDFKLNYIDD